MSLILDLDPDHRPVTQKEIDYALSVTDTDGDNLACRERGPLGYGCVRDLNHSYLHLATSCFLEEDGTELIVEIWE
jgi:hypothetical protein